MSFPGRFASRGCPTARVDALPVHLLLHPDCGGDVAHLRQDLPPMGGDETTSLADDPANEAEGSRGVGGAAPSGNSMDPVL